MKLNFPRDAIGNLTMQVFSDSKGGAWVPDINAQIDIGLNNPDEFLRAGFTLVPDWRETDRRHLPRHAVV